MTVTHILLVMKLIILIFNFDVTDVTYEPRPPIIEGKMYRTINYVLPDVYQLCM